MSTPKKRGFPHESYLPPPGRYGSTYILPPINMSGLSEEELSKIPYFVESDDSEPTELTTPETTEEQQQN